MRPRFQEHLLSTYCVQDHKYTQDISEKHFIEHPWHTAPSRCFAHSDNPGSTD